ncbi:Galactosylceramidase [Durusdinium trenchii]|uniref:Galactosylceramidase n=1 Tax=Durusdinium trenchii TaxID=1381693 RepID=A0ABP0KYN9_9DINO
MPLDDFLAAAIREQDEPAVHRAVRLGADRSRAAIEMIGQELTEKNLEQHQRTRLRPGAEKLIKFLQSEQQQGRLQWGICSTMCSRNALATFRALLSNMNYELLGLGHDSFNYGNRCKYKDANGLDQEVWFFGQEECEPVAFSVQTSYAAWWTLPAAPAAAPRFAPSTWPGSIEPRAAPGRISPRTDLDRRPGAVRFDGFVFAPGSAHEFRVTAQYQGASSAGAAQRQYVFSLTVLPPAAPVVRVVGPHTVAGACSFSGLDGSKESGVIDVVTRCRPVFGFYPSLDASQSYDPSLPPPSTSGLVFEWSCVTASGASCGLNSPDLASAQLLVAGGQLIEGLYNFSVLARRSGETEGAVSVWPIEIANGALPPVSITVPWASDEAVSTQTGGHLGPATASVQGSAGCTVPETWAWTFVLVEETSQSPILAFLNTVASWSNGQLTLSTNDFPGGFLIPGRRYAYAVLQASSQEEMAALESGNLESLIQAEAQGAKTVKSDMFLADGPPSGGLVTVSPVAGYAVTDAFSGTTFAWYDEQVESLTYAFYLLPFTQNTTMTSDGNGGILLGATFETPTVDWTNVTSPFYWSALGGSFLQNVSDPQAAQWDVSVAVGAYVMAVVARDHLGAVSVSYAPGPLVEAPPGGVSPDLALASLDTAMSSGDESVILGALDSLSSVAIASNDTAELAAATEKKMEALDSAANVVGASSDSLSKFGEVAANMLSSEGSGGSAASPAVAERAAGALDTVLTAALDSQGVDPAAGTSLLKATSSVGNSFADGGSDSNVAKGARVSKLRVLFSKLGSALLQQLPAGATSQISTVEGGKGTEIGVVKENANAAIASGVSSKNSQVPGSVLGRRLQENACDSVAVQNTNFVASHWGEE